MQGETLARFSPAGEGEGFQVEWRPVFPPYVWGGTMANFSGGQGGTQRGGGGRELISWTSLHADGLRMRLHCPSPCFTHSYQGETMAKIFPVGLGAKICEKILGWALINLTSI